MQVSTFARRSIEDINLSHESLGTNYDGVRYLHCKREVIVPDALLRVGSGGNYREEKRRESE
jgi:hypothetical protein